MTRFVAFALAGASLSAPLSFRNESPLVSDIAKVVFAFSLFALVALAGLTVLWGRSWTLDERR